ncbi:MAG: YggT family protein [candidate division Zixibacteria bacterium]|nr:YggT family protein [candidate division Zixibacteria bacterium]
MTWLDMVLTGYMAAFGLRLLLPSAGPFSDSPILRGLYAATEPVLRPIRRIVMRGEPRTDWSPLIAVLLLMVLRGGLSAALSGESASTGVAGSVLDATRVAIYVLSVLFLGVFFISIDTPFGYSQIGHMMYTLSSPFLAPIRLLFPGKRRGADPAPLLGIVLLGGGHGLLLFEFSAYLPDMSPLPMGQSILLSLVDLLDTLLDVLFVVILVRALVSWFNPDPSTPMFQALILYSDPILAPIQRIMPSNIGIDFSPLVAILVLLFFQSSVLPLLLRI